MSLPARTTVPAGVVLAATLLLLGGCERTRSAAPAATTSAPAKAPAPRPPPTAPPTTVPASTTTVYAPTAPQQSPGDAAAALIQNWAAGDRAGAAGEATPGAVATLFAIPYPAGYLQPRGCTAGSVNPGTCTYRNTETEGIYEIGVAHGPAGWYVVSVTPEA